MTKEQFLTELESQLKKLPKSDQEEILRDYNEYFTIAQSDGKLEHEVVQALGSPKQLAKELLASYYIEEMQKSASAKNTMRALWAGVGLGFLNLIFIVGPFIGIVSTVASFWLVGIVFLFTPALVLIGAAFNVGSFAWFDFFVALTLSGVGVFILMGLYYITSLLKKWSIRYLKFNVAIVKGDSVNV